MTLIHIVAALMWVIPSSFFLLNHVKYFGLIQPCCQVAKEIIKLYYSVFLTVYSSKSWYFIFCVPRSLLMEMLFKPLQLNKIKLKIFCHWFCSLYSIISVQIVPIFLVSKIYSIWQQYPCGYYLDEVSSLRNLPSCVLMALFFLFRSTNGWWLWRNWSI